MRSWQASEVGGQRELYLASARQNHSIQLIPKKKRQQSGFARLPAPADDPALGLVVDRNSLTYRRRRNRPAANPRRLHL